MVVRLQPFSLFAAIISVQILSIFTFPQLISANNRTSIISSSRNDTQSKPINHFNFLVNCISLLNKLSDEKTDSEHNYNKQNFKQYMSVALSCFFH